MAKANIKLGIELENRILIETLLADFSADFINTPADHRAVDKTSSWAAEVHKYKGIYYLFTTSHRNEVMETIPDRCYIPHHAAQIYVADSQHSPFNVFTDVTHTPVNWASLEGTLWIEDGVPYMVFCYECLQTIDRTMDAVHLPDVLDYHTEQALTIFKAWDAEWSGEIHELGE